MPKAKVWPNDENVQLFYTQKVKKRMESQPFLLVELEDLSTIFAPLKTTTRIKYTCFNVSNNYLILGATSGGLYIFRREPCCFLQLLPNKEGSVTQVAISPDEKLIAFSTVKGIVCILERTSHGAKQLVTTFEHQNEQITCLQWNERNDELFVGDACGKVSILTVSVFPTKSMFQTPSFVLMQLDSKIVQMDFNSNMLLVSTLTKCYICDTTREIFRQVGHKLRDGEYGACIFNTHFDQGCKLDSCKNETDKSAEYSNLSHLKLLCARPGSRVWEVAIDGTVISTHQFKEALATAPRKIFFLTNSSSQNSNLDHTIINGTCSKTQIGNSNFVEQSFNFQKLFIILCKFLFTFKTDGIYIFDPQKASVILWNNEITNIVDVQCIHDLIYIWTGCGKMFALNLIPLEKYLVRLYYQKRYFELVKVCLEFEGFLISQANNCSKLYILHDLDEKYKSDITDRLKPLINKWKENAKNRKTHNAQKLKSGIYLVSNNDQFLLDVKRLHNSRLRPNYLNIKGRSHSVSPERFQNGGLNHRGSSSSLPDLVNERKEDEYADEIVVNGKKKEVKSAHLEVRAEEVVGLCQMIRNAETPSDELVFNVFDQILVSASDNSLDLVETFPLRSYFSEEDVELISDLFHSSLKRKSIFKWLEKFSGDWLTAAADNYPNFLAQNHSGQILQLDYKLSKTLELFSSILKENEIIDLIKQTDIKCYYASLLKILSLFHDSSLSSASLSLFDISSPPKILNKVYFLLNVGQIDQIAKYSFKLTLQDMLYLMLKFEESSKNLGKSSEIIELQCHTLFLSYLEKMPEAFKLITDCSDLIENYVINCLENINSAATCVTESSCTCGFPWPCLQATITMFPDIGRALIDKTWFENPSKCLEICNKVPYLWKYLIFIRRKEELDTILPLILQLGEVQELENRWKEIKEGHLEACIRHLIRLKQGNCLNCDEKIKNEYYSTTWTEFGLLCVKLLGPLETLKLFMKYSEDISSAELNQSFFQGLIFSFIMEKHTKGLRKNVIDLLTGRGTQESNKVSVLSEKHKEDLIGKTSVEKFTLANNESKSHHWGIKVNLKGNCPVCSLPLNTKVLISEAGLIGFKCSHVFHAACLRKINLRCPLCENNTGE